MRKIVVGAFVSLDGVMQAPGGPEEDRSGGFEHGGWLVPHWDDAVGAGIGQTFKEPYDLLLGRKTYDIFAAHWPHVQKDPAAKDYDAGSAEMGRTFDAVTKYVATHRPESLTWQNSKALGDDVVTSLRVLKRSEGPRLLTQGSTELVHTLLAADLVDELHILTFPVVLGKGKRMFAEGAPASFKLTSNSVSPSGVVIAAYERAGGIATGSFALAEPTPEEPTVAHE
jgi:dihydrofolate reductase